MPIRTFLPSLAVFVLLLVACGSVSGLPGGKPSTSAPRTNDLSEHLDLCAKRVDAIYDWEREQARKIEDEWIDEKRGLWQSSAKLQRLQEEAYVMRADLQDNCNDAYREKFGNVP